MSDNWDDLASWWKAESASDPAYVHDVNPLLIELMADAGTPVVDLGCGEGQGMRLIGGAVTGVDLSMSLAAAARAAGPVIVAELPDLTYFVHDAFAAAYSVYLLDLIDDHDAFFVNTARVVRPGGHLVVIINHPVYTAPASAPLMDPDGEILWRWGRYFDRGSEVVPVGPRSITFHHRPVGALLTAAARAGWRLETMVERPLGPSTVAELPGYEGQDGIPRLLGVRWVRDGADRAAR